MPFFAVFLHNPPIDADELVAVFAAAGFRTAVDARAVVARAAGGVVVDDADAVSAERLKDALAHRGHEASVVDVAALPPLPQAQRTKEVIVKDDHLDVADSLGRLVALPFSELRALAAITAKVVSQQPKAALSQKPSASEKALQTAASVVLPGARSMGKLVNAMRGNTATTMSTEMAESDETFVEIVATSRRVRLDQSGVVLRAGGPRTLAEWAAALEARAPSSVTRQRGFVALAQGAVVPRLKSVREFEREVAWTIWRSRL